MYSRWRKIRGVDKDDPIENKGHMQSSLKDFENKKLNEDDTYLPPEEYGQTHFEQAIFRIHQDSYNKN